MLATGVLQIQKTRNLVQECMLPFFPCVHIHYSWIDVVVAEPKKEEVKEVAPQPEEKPKATETKPEESPKFVEALKQLEDMGFHNKQLNIELMRKFNGDVIKIVQELLNQDF